MKEKTIKEVLEMDVKSEEFFEAYKAISDKYWTFENPDTYQQCAKAMVMFAERFDPAMVIMATKIIEQVVEMEKNKTKACTGTVGFKNASYFFDIYESEVQKDGLEGMLKKAHSAMAKGKVQIKGQRGKRFF